MKRFLALFLVLVMCLSLCSCNNREKRAILAVEASIDAIGTVTEDSGHDILVAETMYRGLPTEEQRRQVSNYHVLQQARKEFDALQTAVWLTTENFAEYFRINNYFGVMEGPSEWESQAKLEWFIEITPVRPVTARDIEIKLSVIAPERWSVNPNDKTACGGSYGRYFEIKLRLSEDGHYNGEHFLLSYGEDGKFTLPDSYCKMEIISVSGSFIED